MKIPSLKKVKTEDLNLLYIDEIKKWASAPLESYRADLIAAVADEIERRGKTVPTDEVRAEFQSLVDRAVLQVHTLKSIAQR